MDHQAPKTLQKRGRPVAATEKRLGLALIGVLMIIAGGLWVVQSHFDLAAWREQPQSPKTPAPAETERTSDEAPAGLTALGPAETYDAQSLSNKIDGKAELYLAAGFRQLVTRRFALASDPNRWLERYVYDMGQRRGAFAVFSAQRRPNLTPLILAADAYRSANGLFLAQGRYYVEIVAADLSPELILRMESLARQFVDAHRQTAEEADEGRFLPAENRVAHSMALIAGNAFGIEGWNWIYTAQYRWEAAEATAFVSHRANAKEAADLADAFAAYFTEYGGEKLSLPQGPAGLRAFTVMDNVEMVFTSGPYLAGVHDASDRNQALALAVRLRHNLQESGRGE